MEGIELITTKYDNKKTKEEYYIITATKEKNGLYKKYNEMFGSKLITPNEKKIIV